MTTGKYAETPSVDPLHCNVLEHFEQIRTLHVAAALGSGSLFLLRGLAMLAGSWLGMAAPVRYLSYAIDSVLLGAAIALARETDLIASVPGRHTERLRRGMHTFDLPFETPELAIAMLWHPRMDADAAHRWLRACVREVCARATE